MPRKPKSQPKKTKKSGGWVKAVKNGLTIAQQVATLALSVNKIMKVINAEQRYYDKALVAVNVGQCSGNSDVGYYIADITPIPAEGVATQQRIGSSIKLAKLHFHAQLQQQGSSTLTPVRLRICIFQNLSATVAVNATLAGQLWLVNPMNGSNYTDYNSERNPDFMRDYRKVFEKRVTLPVDATTTTLQTKDLKFNLSKFARQHIRFSLDTTTVSEGQLILMVTADSGNISGATAQTSSPNLANSATSSGANFVYTMRSFYYDN